MRSEEITQNIELIRVIKMNSKVYKWCAVPQCKNTSKRTPSKVFVYVPNKKIIRYKWLQLARRNPKEIVTNSTIYFCEDQFDLPNDMENYMQYHVMGSVSQVRMKPGCMPHKLMCQPDWKKQTSDTAKLPYIDKNQRMIDECKQELEAKYLVTKQSSSVKITSGGSDSITGGFEDSLAPESPPTPQCRFCAELTENCIDVTEDRPYLIRNKTILTLNDLCVQLDFNNDTPKTVCRDCDGKLLAMFDFVKQVQEAQESMINVRNNVKHEVDIVKTECESRTQNDEDEILRESNVEGIDDTEDLVDFLTVSETVILKPGVTHKRKQLLVPKPHKKPKVIEDVKRLECEDSELIDDVKEEIAEMVDEYEAEYLESSDTETGDHIPSELELGTILKLMK